MLETRLFGYFLGEDRRLAFLPARPYLFLIGAVFVAAAIALLNVGTMMIAFHSPPWWALVGAMLLGAGAMAVLSLRTVWFDLREGRYLIRQGGSLLPRSYTGPISNFDALVLIAERRGAKVNYHLVLHFRGQVEPPIVLQSDSRLLPHATPLNAAAGPILHQGQRYARALKLPFYDNSHFPSANPMPLFR